MNFATALLSGPALDEHAALLTAQGEVAYGQLKDDVQQVAAWLVGRGVRPGDRVILAGESSRFWVQCYLGIAWAGAVSVPVAVPADAANLDAIVAQCEPVAACVQVNWLKRMATAWARCGAVLGSAPPPRTLPDIDLTVVTDLPMDQSAEAFPARADDLAVINFTSGSSSTPRGVMISHGNILANTADIIRSLDIGPADRVMAVLPFHYCFGASLLHTHLSAGGSVVIDNRFLFPDKVLERMRETACTTLAGVPSTYQILLRRSSLKEMEFPGLVKLQQAGGALAESFIAELTAALPEAALYVMYGQTEATARLSCLSPAERSAHPGTVGRGLDHSRLEIVDENGQVLPAGRVGEIVATGPHIAMGYWRDAAASARIFDNGRLLTGDLGRMDEDGYITIVDRARDFLKCAGNRVSCRQLEERILGFPGLIEAAVIGVPDELLGEGVCLFAVHPDGEACAAELDRFCNDHLAPATVPVRVVFLPQLPRNRAGKPDKPALRQLADAPS